MLSKEEISHLSEEFESKTPQEIIAWATSQFTGKIAMSSSFQTQSLPLLHMVTRVQPDLKIFFWNRLPFLGYAYVAGTTRLELAFERGRPVP